MRRALLATSLLFAAAAVRALPTAAPAAAPSADVAARTRALLRAIRSAARNPGSSTDDLRRGLAELESSPDAASVADRLARAEGYLTLLDEGRPLPPPTPDEVDADAEPEAEREESEAPAPAAATQQAAATALAAARESRVSELASALAGPAASGAFDGALVREAAPVVEPEPAAGYHTVNADAYLSASEKDGADLLTRGAAELLAKAGVKDASGARAKALAKLIGARLKKHPQRGRMLALRLRVRPDGKIVLVYRLADAGVVVQELDLALGDEVSKPASIRGTKKKRKPAKPKSHGDDGDGGGKGGKSGGGKKAKSPGAPDFGAGGGPGGVGAAGRGGAGRGGKSGGRGGDGVGGGDEDGAIMPLKRTASVNPDGGASASRRGARAKAAAVPGARSADRARGEGRGAAAGAADGESGSGRRKEGKDAKVAKNAKDSLPDLPGLPHLSGDRPHGRPGAEKPAGAPAAASATLAAAATNSAAAAADTAAAALAAEGGGADDVAPRDAVAAGPALVPAPRASARLAYSGSDAPAPPAGPGAAAAALFAASAALGVAGLLLGRRG